MQIDVLPAEKLDADHLAAWSRLVADEPELDSPFFRPEFTRVVTSVRSDVEVALLQEQDEVVGFFPFQRVGGRRARPVGAGFSEFQAVIARSSTNWDCGELLRKCDLRACEFDHVLASQSQFAPQLGAVGHSPYIDLSRGFEAYCLQRRQAGSSIIKGTARKLRKLEREVGPLRFELHTDEQQAFDLLLRWKSAQHKRTGVLDVFRFPWVVELLKTIRSTQTNGFSGMMSVLYAGKMPLAVHLGMKTPSVAHAWYPAYNVAYARYSPGLILFLELAKHLSELGVQRFDFGPGPQRYKRSLMSGAIRVARGTVYRCGTAPWAGRSWSAVCDRLRASPLRATLRFPSRVTSRFQRWLALRPSPRTHTQ